MSEIHILAILTPAPGKADRVYMLTFFGVLLLTLL